MFVRRPSTPARKLSFSSRVGVARGLLRAARFAAERDKCLVAELLLAYAAPDLVARQRRSMAGFVPR